MAIDRLAKGQDSIVEADGHRDAANRARERRVSDWRFHSAMLRSRDCSFVVYLAGRGGLGVCPMTFLYIIHATDQAVVPARGRAARSGTA